MYDYLLTVFTPTYNRAYIIKNVYDSLVLQTEKNFEWLVVDDGSSDNTEELIKSLIKEKKIHIRYVKKENGGQHTALNLAIEEAMGKMLMIVDSDDYLKPNAVERVLYWENTINDKGKYAGVSGLRIHQDGTVIGQKWNSPNPYIDATNFEREKYGLLGDKSEAYYTDILKKYYPIPVFKGENDVEKAVMWNRIAHGGYKVRWFNEGIYVCEYLDDGMSHNIVDVHLKNFKGFTCWKKELIDMQSNYINVVRETSSFVGMAAKKGLSTKEMANTIGRKPVTIHLAKLHQLLYKAKRKLLGR